MDSDELRLVLQTIRNGDDQRFKLLPGLVTEIGGTFVEVRLDNDPDGVDVQAACLFADVMVGDRVMLLFAAPRGVYVMGTIGRAHEAGQMLFFSGVENEVIDNTTFDVGSGVVELHAGRAYLFTVAANCIALTAVAPADVTRVQPSLAYVNQTGTAQNINPFTNVDRTSTPAAHGSVSRSRLVVPTQTYVTPVSHQVNVLNDSVRVWSTATVTDVGPAATVV